MTLKLLARYAITNDHQLAVDITLCPPNSVNNCIYTLHPVQPTYEYKIVAFGAANIQVAQVELDKYIKDKIQKLITLEFKI